MKTLHIHELTVATVKKENLPPVDLVLFEEPPINLTQEQIKKHINHSLDNLLKHTERFYQNQTITFLNFELDFYITDKELYSVVKAVKQWSKKNLVELQITEK